MQRVWKGRIADMEADAGAVAGFKALRRSRKSEREIYIKRKNAVNKILSSVENRLDDDIRAVNSKLSSCQNHLEAGMKGVAASGNMAAAMDSCKEKSSGSDPDISSCASDLRREIQRCQSQTEALEDEIRGLEASIREHGGTIYFWE